MSELVQAGKQKRAPAMSTRTPNCYPRKCQPSVKEASTIFHPVDNMATLSKKQRNHFAEETYSVSVLRMLSTESIIYDTIVPFVKLWL